MYKIFKRNKNQPQYHYLLLDSLLSIYLCIYFMLKQDRNEYTIVHLAFFIIFFLDFPSSHSLKFLHSLKFMAP